MKDCDICGGTKFVFIPTKPKLSVIDDGDSIPTFEPAGRQYTCPECSTGGPVSTLRTMESTQIVSRQDAEAYRPHALRGAAQKIAEKIALSGLISMEEIELQSFMGDEVGFRCSLGVVSPDHVATLAERVRNNDMQTINLLERSCKEEIRLWGSTHSGDTGTISKGQACDAVSRAVKSMVARCGGR